MSNRRAAARRKKRLNKVPHHIWIQRRKNKLAVQLKARKLAAQLEIAA